MPQDDRAQITRILNDLDAGRLGALPAAERMFTPIYRELRNLAGGLMRGERAGHSLRATALVHEAFLRLVGPKSARWQNRAHFFGAAARAMRQVLVDHARERQAHKRGGDRKQITLSENLGRATPLDDSMLDLDRAMTKLGEIDPRMLRIAELRIFGGRPMQEIADVLGVSRSTVQKDWRVAKMWLARDIDGGPTA